jgi:hypothetical protein
MNNKCSAILFVAVSSLAATNSSLLVAAESSFPITDISLSEQNAMMENYCVICHLDAANVSPPLAAILVSKFTTGVPLENVLKPELDSQIIEEIEFGKRFGAPSVMDIAGLPLPTDGEINGFIMAMAQRTNTAERWHIVESGENISADIIRVTSLPVREDQGPRDLTYRLVLTCNTTNGEGEMLLTWSPVPANGEVEVFTDNESLTAFIIDEQEPMANGDSGTSAPSSVVLSGFRKNDDHPNLSIPRTSLRIRGPLATEQVEFSFDDLWSSEPQLLNSCFNA